MVQDDSHSTFRDSADSISRRAVSIAMTCLPELADPQILVLPPPQNISNFRAIPVNIGIYSHILANLSDFIPMTELDPIDRKILAAMQSDGRITMQELADKVGLSVSPCHRRVKLLEERGVITRYIATVDQKS